MGMTLTSMAGKARDVKGAISLGATQTPSVTSLHGCDQVWAPVAACVDESPLTPTWLRKLWFLASHFTSKENMKYLVWLMCWVYVLYVARTRGHEWKLRNGANRIPRQLGMVGGRRGGAGTRAVVCSWDPQNPSCP